MSEMKMNTFASRVILSEVCSFIFTLISFCFEAYIFKFSAASVRGGTSECPSLIG